MQWKILQQSKPDDYVIATGKTTSVREFVNECCKYLNLKIIWQGKGINEKAYILNGNKKELAIKIDKKYYRPLEIDYLKGNPKKALRKLKYKLKHNLKDLVRDMIDSDLKLYKKKINEKTDCIFIAGHNGLVGSSVVKILKNEGYKNIITVKRDKLDLRDHSKVIKYFKNKKIDYLVMAAARAGGIIANSSNQRDFFFDNIEIQNSLLKLAQKKSKEPSFWALHVFIQNFLKHQLRKSIC